MRNYGRIIMAVASLTFAGCGGSSGAGENDGTTADLGRQAAETYARIAFGAYQDGPRAGGSPSVSARV